MNGCCRNAERSPVTFEIEKKKKPTQPDITFEDNTLQKLDKQQSNSSVKKSKQIDQDLYEPEDPQLNVQLPIKVSKVMNSPEESIKPELQESIPIPEPLPEYNKRSSDHFTDMMYQVQTMDLHAILPLQTESDQRESISNEPCPLQQPEVSQFQPKTDSLKQQSVALALSNIGEEESFKYMEQSKRTFNDSISQNSSRVSIDSADGERKVIIEENVPTLQKILTFYIQKQQLEADFTKNFIKHIADYSFEQLDYKIKILFGGFLEGHLNLLYEMSYQQMSATINFKYKCKSTKTALISLISSRILVQLIYLVLSKL
ncbi:Hypothetical_protein [Hexamita inflata]|uniref:Hypothetical_protein n=1 Tax=Hexamita inflata TaxID=28002 RepID=A0AA86R6J6_9EUKA|nr:Hypothetical protein HINF_LOCUS59076 [Hexamita inflata]CAI9972361.1 Hypothetical protein HINF_LOCUS60006 [Hexamita inflata]